MLLEKRMAPLRFAACALISNRASHYFFNVIAHNGIALRLQACHTRMKRMMLWPVGCDRARARQRLARLFHLAGTRAQ